jgi:homoserine dehydrogenase
MQTQTARSSADAAVFPARVAIVGFGTVGRSVAKILASRADGPLRVTCVCNRNVERKRVDWLPSHVRWTETFDDVLAPDVDIVVELIGGLEPAGDLIRRALRAGKAVVTANKQLIAQHGAELLDLARTQDRSLLYEASVAGGLPVVRAIQEGLAGDQLYRIAGILNGTCNYILNRMETAGLPFADALAEAQALGFAEADPTADVDGHDAQAKLAILTTVGLQCRVRQSDIHRGSIRPIEPIDFTYARRLDCTVRQVSWAERGPQRRAPGRSKDEPPAVFASVQLALVPLASPLAKVEGSQNLVTVCGQYGGETAFLGLGAGGDPTAVAVVSDLLSITRTGPMFVGPRLSTAGGYQEVSADFSAPHYMRFTVADRPGIIASLATVLAQHGINIDAVLQLPGFPQTRLPFVMTLEACHVSVLDEALTVIRALPFHVEDPVTAPILIRAARLGGTTEGHS